MTNRLYKYFGPDEIGNIAKQQPAGTPIQSVDDLIAWLSLELTEQNLDGEWVATFTVSANQTLRVAPRRSEHVACASGGPVLSAGEITFSSIGDVVYISNQSTGFCPEPESWRAIEPILDSIGLTHPGSFTNEVIFRMCPKCNQRNIVKDTWYQCELCEAELPASWNF